MEDKERAEDRLSRMQRRVLGIIQEEMYGWINDLMRDMFDPSRVIAFVQAMGMDASLLSGMISKQAGFDPYRILGLDKSASDEEIKKRCREFMHKLHPDTAGMLGTEFFFQLAKAAYEAIKAERGWQ